MNKIPKDSVKNGVHPLLFVVLLMVLLLVIAVGRFLTPSIVKVESARFMGDAEAAYSIIHDDLCSEEAMGLFDVANPMAHSRGINLGFAAIASHCADGGDTLWEKMQELVDNGHEIMAHSWQHGSPIDLGWKAEEWSNDTDVILAKKVLEDNLNTTITWFVFPYDSYNDQRIAEIEAAGFIGARAGYKDQESDRGVNGILKNFEPLRTNFDIYMSQEEQAAILASDNVYMVSIYPNNGRSVAIQHIDAAIAIAGWSVQEIHTVAPASDSVWGSITPEAYKELLDYGVQKRDSGELWIDTPTKIASYIMVRNSLGGPVVKKGELHHPNAQSAEPYESPVTTIVTTQGSPRLLIATIDGIEHKISPVARNRFLITAFANQRVVLKLKK